MRSRKLLPLCLIAVMLTFSATAQEKWDLRKCVEYAIANNISVKQADVQKRIAEVQMKQAKLGLLPTLSFGNGNNFGFGVSRQFANQNLIEGTTLTTNFGLQSNVTLFNWFSAANNAKAAAFTAEAAMKEVDRVKNDVSLNVAAAYLQALLSIEQRRVADVQLAQTKDQLSNTRRLVDAGSLPELNAAELEAQAARDTAAVVSAYATVQNNLLQLKALLNIDAAAPFELAAPEANTIPIEPIGELQPDAVYAMALQSQPLQKANELRVASAEKSALAAKGQLYPTISLSAGIGTNYFAVFDKNYPNPAFFPYLEQVRQQSIGINLSVPIFQGYQLRGNYDRARLNTQSVTLTQEQDNYTLKQNIYQAYIDATAALQTFNAQQTAVKTAQKSYDFSKLRYDEGLLNTIDLIISQSNLTRAKIEMLSAQYDYVFTMKVLEFYKGQGLKL